jgi:hypothetical protein
MDGTIPYKDLMELHNNYQPTQDYLSAWKSKPDTQSIWFAMDSDFRKFLEELLKMERGVSGVRVYLGEYKEGTTPQDPDIDPKNYVRKLTVGFVATKQIGPKTHIDHPDEVANKTNLAFAAYNHGKICPPDYCPQ